MVEFCDIYAMDMWSYFGMGEVMDHGGKRCSLLWEAEYVL